VAMVNDAFVKKYLQGRNPLDERFGLNCPGKADQFAIVGVAANSKAAPRQVVTPTVYLPLGQTGNAATLIVRVNGPPERMIPVLRRAMSELNAMVPTFGEVTPIALRERRMQQERLLMTLLTGFAAVAVILSSIGIYGMLAYTVARRTSEIGLRMALGAGKRDVMLMIVRESLAPVALGLTIGAVSAIVATRWIDTLLYGVSAHDPLMMIYAAATFLAVAAVAAAMPARRAARIDPLRALRFE
jgi:ABC-type antimicrobial peptide transport system permease subunit